MRTTWLNPTLWLLAATCAAATWAAIRGTSARRAFTRVLQVATLAPVLSVLVVAAAGGLVSRVVVGYMAPGAYAEEVVAARAFLSERALYHGNDRQELRRWLHEEPAPRDPWTLPGLSSCQASAFEHRPEFFTSQAHSPFLLLASVPIVGLAGGRGLYIALLALSIAGLVVVWIVLVRMADVAPRSREAVLLGVALAGWQPVLAGLKQGDAVLLAGALVVAAWSLARHGRDVPCGVLAGAAAALALPAAAVLLAAARRPSALAAGLVTVALASAVTMAIGGPLIVVDFARNVAATAGVYAQAMPNYAVAGRLAGGGPGRSVAVAMAGAVLATAAAWQARDVDRAWSLFAALGLLFAPLAWSQHLVLALVPLTVLFSRALHAARALPLAAWALVALVLSLPDPAVAIASEALQAGRTTPWPIVPAAIAALAVWLLVAHTGWRTGAREAWAQS